MPPHGNTQITAESSITFFTLQGISIHENYNSLNINES